MIRLAQRAASSLARSDQVDRPAHGHIRNKKHIFFFLSFFFLSDSVDGRVKVEDGEEGMVREGVGFAKALMFCSSGC